MEIGGSKQKNKEYPKSNMIKPYLLYPDEKNNFDFDENKVMNINDIREKASMLIEIIRNTPMNYINKNYRRYDNSMAYLHQVDVGRRFIEDGKEILERDLKINKKAINILNEYIDEFFNIEDLDERAKLLEWCICYCDNGNSERARRLLLKDVENFTKSNFLDERLLTLKALKYCDENEITELKKQCLDSLVSYIEDNRSVIDKFISSDNNLSPELKEKCYSILADAFEYVAVEGSKDEALKALDYLSDIRIDNILKLWYYRSVITETKNDEIAFATYKKLINLDGDEDFLNKKVEELIEIAVEVNCQDLAFTALTDSFKETKDVYKYILDLKLHIIHPYMRRHEKGFPDFGIKKNIYKMARDLLFGNLRDFKEDDITSDIKRDLDCELDYYSIIAVETDNEEIGYEALEELTAREINEEYFNKIINKLLYIASEAELENIALKSLKISFNNTDIYKYISSLRALIMSPYEDRAKHNIKESVYKIAKEFEREALSQICKNPQESPVIIERGDEEILYIPVSVIDKGNETFYIIASKCKTSEDKFVIPNTSIN